MLQNCVEFATAFLPTNLQTYMRLLDAIGSAIFDGSIAEVKCNRKEVLGSTIWKHDALGFFFENFLALAVHLNLFEFVEANISRMQPGDQVVTASRLLIVAALKNGQWLKHSETPLLKDQGNSERVCGVDQESDHASESLVITEQYWMALDSEEIKCPNCHMMRILMRYRADPDFQAYGTSARQILDVRRSELAHLLNFQGIMRIFGCARDDSGSLTKRAKSVFHRKS